MFGRRNTPAQADRFEELHLSEIPTFDIETFLQEALEQEYPEYEEDDTLSDLDIDEPTDSEIMDMIEVLEGNEPSVPRDRVLARQTAEALLRRFMVVQ